MKEILSIVTGLFSDSEFSGKLLELFKGNKQKQRDFELALAFKLFQANESQIKVNLEEAKHKTIFVAGWRPFIGWVCGSALLYQFILRDFISYLIVIFKADFVAPPSLDLSQLITILLAMLGMASLRTYEKQKLKK